MRPFFQSRPRSPFNCHFFGHTQLPLRYGPQSIACAGCPYDSSILPFSSAFTTSSKILKGGKRNSKHNIETAAAKVSALSHADPHDLSDLESRLTKILSRLKDDLTELRPGGRFNPKVIEDLRVLLVKGSRDTERLGDFAQVVPKGGRSIIIYVGEEAVSFYFGLP